MYKFTDCGRDVYFYRCKRNNKISVHHKVYNIGFESINTRSNMNREILFRGKDFLKEEWVYGDLVKTKNFVAIKKTNGDYFTQLKYHPTLWVSIQA